jgi:hypothetical protein
MSGGTDERPEEVSDEILETGRDWPESAAPGVPIDAKGGDGVR